MPTPYEIPLSGVAQQFDIMLAGLSYNLRLVWNLPANAWVLDIADANSIPLVQGIPLVTGIDLLSQYPHLGIGGQLFAATDANPDAPPTYSNLGDASHLYFLTGA